MPLNQQWKEGKEEEEEEEEEEDCVLMGCGEMETKAKEATNGGRGEGANKTVNGWERECRLTTGHQTQTSE